MRESDTADYTVRNLVGIDPNRNWWPSATCWRMAIRSCSVDAIAKRGYRRRMAEDLKRRIGDKPVRGIYISCAALQSIRRAGRDRHYPRHSLSSFPLAGFFRNGEISRDQVYAYTGVLTLFL